MNFGNNFPSRKLVYSSIAISGSLFAVSTYGLSQEFATPIKYSQDVESPSVETVVLHSGEEQGVGKMALKHIVSAD